MEEGLVALSPIISIHYPFPNVVFPYKLPRYHHPIFTNFPKYIDWNLYPPIMNPHLTVISIQKSSIKSVDLF